MNKILFLDIDGTVLSHTTNTIPPSALLAIEQLQKNGVLVFGCTGRNNIELAHMPIQDFHPDGWITMNGAYCYTNKEVLYEAPLNEKDLHTLYTFLLDHPYPVQFMEKDTIYTNMYSSQYKEGLDAIHTAYDPIKPLERCLNHKIYMMVPWIPKELWERIEPEFIDLSAIRWNDYAVDCFSKKCGKNHGIQAVLNHFHLNQNEAYCIGDAENDIAMFEVCNTSIAMGNATESVKQHATYVTKHIDEDGLAYAIEHYIR